MSMLRFLSAFAFASFAATLSAQTAVGGQGDPFKDTSMIHPPAGAKVAIVEWEDLECPACSRAFPIVHAAVAHYKIPLVEYDFLIPGHLWSKDAALYARYIHDHVSPVVAEDYRRQVFASQYQIASKDDLHAFTVKFFQSKGGQIPFVVDPDGKLMKEVQADNDLGNKMGLMHTPTIFVTTPHGWVQVVDIMQLYSVIDAAIAQTSKAEPVKASAASTTRHTAVKK